jgi:type III secretion system YscQ/HrcQ family protein
MPDPECRGIAISFSIGLSGFSGGMRLFLPFAALETLSAMPTAAQGAAARLPGRTWSLPVSRGWVDLTPEDMAGLEPMDILLYTPHPAVFLPGTYEKGWEAAVQGDNPWSLRIDKYSDWSVRMQENNVPDLRALPVRLHVVIGEKELTLAEMDNLVPNTILELGTGKTDPVRLAVNGRMVGTGELVEVEGRLGVRVLSWS